MVVKENFSRDLSELLFKDIKKACAKLNKAGGKPTPAPDKTKKKICLTIDIDIVLKNQYN